MAKGRKKDDKKPAVKDEEGIANKDTKDQLYELETGKKRPSPRDRAKETVFQKLKRKYKEKLSK